MNNSNEQALLTFLEEQKEQTQSLISSEEKTLNYWVSGEYKNGGYDSIITNAQVDFFITNTETRLKPFRFRLEWLETQITNLKNQ